MNGYNVLDKDCVVVSVIKLPQGLSILKRPQLLDYKNPIIRKIIPCIKQGDSFTDLRSRKVVNVDENTLVWQVSTGTVFKYPDGKDILISRRFKDGKLLLLGNENFAFNQLSMTDYSVK